MLIDCHYLDHVLVLSSSSTLTITTTTIIGGQGLYNNPSNPNNPLCFPRPPPPPSDHHHRWNKDSVIELENLHGVLQNSIKDREEVGSVATTTTTTTSASTTT